MFCSAAFNCALAHHSRDRLRPLLARLFRAGYALQTVTSGAARLHECGTFARGRGCWGFDCFRVQRRVQTRNQLLLFRIGQARFGMHQHILRQRHRATFDLLFHRRRAHIAGLPLGKVERAARRQRVVRQNPRHGRDVTVPQPLRFVTVTIETRAFSQRARLRTVPLWLRDDGRIGALRSNRQKLDQQEHRRADDENDNADANYSFVRLNLLDATDGREPPSFVLRLSSFILHPSYFHRKRHRVQLKVRAALAQQLVVRPFFDDAPLVNHHDLVRARDGGQAMRDDK